MKYIYYFAVVVEGPKGSDYYRIWYPDFPGISTSCNNIDHAKAKAIEFLQIYVENSFKKVQDLPKPSTKNSIVAIPGWIEVERILIGITL